MATVFSAALQERATCLAQPLNQIVVGHQAEHQGMTRRGTAAWGAISLQSTIGIKTDDEKPDLEASAAHF